MRSPVEMAWRRLQEVSQPVCAAARQRLEEESDSSSRLGSIRLLHALWEEFAAAATNVSIDASDAEGLLKAAVDIVGEQRVQVLPASGSLGTRDLAVSVSVAVLVNGGQHAAHL